jgi:crotonobetainyl-CoA:carnitine CoA-transferase CaiB-like acyl-CoA transferase
MGSSLAGTLVVALEQAVAGPMCTMRLADAGARVIKIERPSGDFARDYDHVVHGESAYFVWLNRGKESVALDFTKPDDAALMRRMIAGADVFIQNLAPGAAERAGFGSPELRRLHPRLITCDISGYGDEGPYRDMKAYDLLVQCETGLASITGTPEGPGRVGVSVADIACGMNAHAGVLEALYERTRTGEGKAISVSLFDALADWMTVPLLHFEYGGRAPQRAGSRWWSPSRTNGSGAHSVTASCSRLRSRPIHRFRRTRTEWRIVRRSTQRSRRYSRDSAGTN